jgi:hypothetical protein
MKALAFLTLVVLSGCTTAPRLQVDLTDHSRMYLLCEKYDRPEDDRIRYRCNSKRLLEFEAKF